jgi:hypothetical protein
MWVVILVHFCSALGTEFRPSSFEKILENLGLENQPSKRTRFSFENLGRILQNLSAIQNPKKAWIFPESQDFGESLKRKHFKLIEYLYWSR